MGQVGGPLPPGREAIQVHPVGKQPGLVGREALGQGRAGASHQRLLALPGHGVIHPLQGAKIIATVVDDGLLPEMSGQGYCAGQGEPEQGPLQPGGSPSDLAGKPGAIDSPHPLLPMPGERQGREHLHSWGGRHRRGVRGGGTKLASDPAKIAPAGGTQADGVDPEHPIIGQEATDQMLGAGGVSPPILAEDHQLTTHARLSLVSAASGGVRSQRERITRAGLPAATTSAGRSRVTTLPAATTVPRPMRTPAITMTPVASQT
ncbi:hypothetical protein WL1483_1986 [Aeromonas schubertii]|uniref:Uncharacterized protein n=1 Tax=Aeromonas schubertii TaxID=652 RepID=A0A0S2SI83_9GAMM|nr:hypothetical protein WL1483_1986 [Aeromonas schubertii]